MGGCSCSNHIFWNYEYIIIKKLLWFIKRCVSVQLGLINMQISNVIHGN